MNPTQTVQTHDSIAKSNKKKLTWGLVCLVGPTLLLILTILLYAAANFITSASSGGSGGSNTIANVLLYLVGAATALTWLPGVIVGIVLLATRKPHQQQPPSLL